MTLDLLDTNAVAELLGVRPATIRVYKLRGRLPQPDAVIGGHPAWERHTIEQWAANRPGQGAGGGRRPTSEPQAQEEDRP